MQAHRVDIDCALGWPAGALSPSQLRLPHRQGAWGGWRRPQVPGGQPLSVGLLQERPV